jgi:hypothetical protein
MVKIANVLMFVSLLVGVTTAQAEQLAGKVAHLNGALVAQRLDGTIKVLGMNSDVYAGDMLITAKDSYAQIQMSDGGQMTLRPSSNLRIETFHYQKDEPQSDNAILRLLKGGFRTVTGLIGKRGNRDAYKLHAATATIGIRGTDFSTRMCRAQNCADDDNADAGKVQPVRPAEVSTVVGRVMLVQGDFAAKQADGKAHALAQGAPVYEGDLLMTGANSNALVGFRDESRISLRDNSQFVVEKFKYDKEQAQENAVLRLVKGGARVFTGWIGRIKHDNYQFKLATATIGIRGTGFDAWCNGACVTDVEHPGADESQPMEGAGVYVWSGEVVLQSACEQPTCVAQIVGLQQAAIISRDSGKPVQLQTLPQTVIDNPAPRPDLLPINTEELFGAQAAGNPGVYLMVHEGEVSMLQGGKLLILNQGETGYGSNAGLMRLNSTPGFIGDDLKVNFQDGSARANSSNAAGCMIR